MYTAHNKNAAIILITGIIETERDKIARSISRQINGVPNATPRERSNCY